MQLQGVLLPDFWKFTNYGDCNKAVFRDKTGLEEQSVCADTHFSYQCVEEQHRRISSLGNDSGNNP